MGNEIKNAQKEKFFYQKFIKKQCTVVKEFTTGNVSKRATKKVIS